MQKSMQKTYYGVKIHYYNEIEDETECFYTFIYAVDYADVVAEITEAYSESNVEKFSVERLGDILELDKSMYNMVKKQIHY